MDNALISIVSIVLFCFGSIMLLSALNQSEYDKYTFEYIYTESIDGSDIQTVIQNCVNFNATETDIKVVKQKFIEDHDHNGKLVIRQSCDRTFLGTPVYKNLTYDLDANNVLTEKAGH